MGISDKIDNTMNAIDETKILEIKATISTVKVFRNHCLTSKFCLVNHLVIIECL